MDGWVGLQKGGTGETNGSEIFSYPSLLSDNQSLQLK